MDIKFKNLISKIVGSNDLLSISEAVSYLENNRTSILSASNQETVTALQFLMQKYKELKTQLDLFQEFADSDKKQLMDIINSRITNESIAIAACDHYNENWFKNLCMSIDAKVEIASSLLNAISKYTSRGNNFWQSISVRDPLVLQTIAYQPNE